MRFYTNLHPYYCGIDLHARTLYVCIIDDKGETLVHKQIGDDPDALFKIIEPYIGNIIIGVECMHCWYWVADWCEEIGVDFVLGHALYMKAIHGGKAKNDKIDSYKIAKLLRGGNFPIAYTYPKLMRATRDLLRRRMKIVRHGAQLKAHVKNTTSQYNLPPNNLNLRYPKKRDQMRDKFSDPSVQQNIDLDINLIDCYEKELCRVELHIKKHAKQHNATEFNLLKTISGVGDILALTMLYEIGDINRFESVQTFASYSHLVKCKAESAGKTYGTQGNKIGNAHLKWAFSEAAILYIRNNESGKNFIAKLEKRMAKSKALSVLAHKLGRAIFFMLKNHTVFDENKFLNV
tara:strand:- start:475 stop:1518 length:1044 start_codon:yes stop_codon:yes gene_type:complete